MRNINYSLPFDLQIILKSCRETHCHYCLNQLRADTVPCTSCTIPLYCSEHCQIQAGGEPFSNFQDKIGTKESHSHSHGEYKFALCSDSNPIECFPEHKHECLGVNWPAILPSDIVLAGRILVKSTSQRCSTESNALCDLVHLMHIILHQPQVFFLNCGFYPPPYGLVGSLSQLYTNYSRKQIGATYIRNCIVMLSAAFFQL